MQDVILGHTRYACSTPVCIGVLFMSYNYTVFSTTEFLSYFDQRYGVEKYVIFSSSSQKKKCVVVRRNFRSLPAGLAKSPSCATPAPRLQLCLQAGKPAPGAVTPPAPLLEEGAPARFKNCTSYLAENPYTIPTSIQKKVEVWVANTTHTQKIFFK